MRNLRNVFAPRSIAVIGASDVPGKVGTVTLANLVRGGFPGPIYPVNPAPRDRCKACRRIAASTCCRKRSTWPSSARRRRPFPTLVRQCGEAGVGGLIILTAGFREIGAAGPRVGRRIVQRRAASSADADPRAELPGHHRAGIKLNASFAAATPPKGHIGFISQSGALVHLGARLGLRRRASASRTSSRSATCST